MTRGAAMGSSSGRPGRRGSGRRSSAARVLVLLAAFAVGPARADPPAAERADRVVVDTRARTLTLLHGDRELARYPVGFGAGGVGKQVRGDRRTPRGTYRLLAGRASRRFGRFLPVSYPGAEDARRGLAAGLIDRAEHDAIVAAERRGELPPQGTRLGGDIGLHGYGVALGFVAPRLQLLHWALDVTDGCLLVSDADVRAIERRTRGGATLVIR